jgi:hypothetical protein
VVGIERENEFFIGELVRLDAAEMLDPAIFYREIPFFSKYLITFLRGACAHRFAVFIGEMIRKSLLL